jgi:hypothetical protein
MRSCMGSKQGPSRLEPFSNQKGAGELWQTPRNNMEITDSVISYKAVQGCLQVSTRCRVAGSRGCTLEDARLPFTTAANW